MPRLSQEKINRISEQILEHLYQIFPKLVFTSDIAKEIARDEEFVKKILINLEKKGLLVQIKKNHKGEKYAVRSRWRLSNKAYSIYKSIN